MSETRVERGTVASFGVLARGTHGTFRGPREHLALQTRLTAVSGGGQEYLLVRRKVENGNSGYSESPRRQMTMETTCVAFLFGAAVGV